VSPVKNFVIYQMDVHMTRSSNVLMVNALKTQLYVATRHNKSIKLLFVETAPTYVKTVHVTPINLNVT